MSSTIEDKIRSAATKNQELLQVLSQTDYAPPALEQQQKYIADINQELSQLSKRISQLESSRKKELKDHEKYRDSVMKRFAYRVGRKTEKFEAKADKEEKEYFAALQEEHRAKEHEKSLRSNLAEAESQKSQLSSTASQHAKAQADLSALYDSIFEGPSPGFPEEDDAEATAQRALSRYHNVRVQVESEQHALHLLSQARQRMGGALAALDEARSHSQMDMFGGGMMFDMMERNALARAESLSSEVQMLVMQAARMSPQVKGIPRANVAQGNLMSDVLFDNVFTDHAFHQKIKASQDQMHQSAAVLENEWQGCRARIDGMAGSLREDEGNLERARKDLQRVRETVFERVAGDGPPQYQY